MPGSGVEIRQAAIADLDALAPLFDAYRRFYRLPGDPNRAREFLRERFERSQSVVFLARRLTLARRIDLGPFSGERGPAWVLR
jgi:hypothetical protein